MRIRTFPERLVIATLSSGIAGSAAGQTLRFSNHRDIEVPAYALVRIGPFYSNVGFTQTAGYRYTHSRGRGTDFLIANRRGIVEKDGHDLPLVSTVNLRNYLILTRQADLDASVRIAYAHYPLDTQRDSFHVDLAEEGMLGDLSMELAPTPFVKSTLYDRFVYRTDYLDTRGLGDEQGGQACPHLNNQVGVNLDWLMRPDRNLALSVFRSDWRTAKKPFRNQEQVTHQEWAAYEQRVNPFVAVGIGARFRQTDFRRPTRADWTGQEYFAHGNAQVTDRTRASAEIGYALATVVAGSEAEDEDVSTMIGALSLETQLFKHLGHSLSVNRSLRTGFDSSVETVDTASYRLQGNTDLATWTFSSHYSVVAPSRDEVNGYADWVNQLEGTWPLTGFLILRAMTRYAMRENEPVRPGVTVDPEWEADYATWVTRLGTGFNLFKELTCTVYAQHVERYSSSDLLRYQRDIIGLDLVYSHTF